MSETKVTFAMLQERFVIGLERRLGQLNANFAALGTVDATQIAATADEMMRGFHSLAGIGGTYGFPHITEIARHGELASAKLKTTVTDPALAAIAETLNSLATAAVSAKNAIHGQNSNRSTTAQSQAA